MILIRVGLDIIEVTIHLCKFLQYCRDILHHIFRLAFLKKNCLFYETIISDNDILLVMKIV